MVRKSPRLDRRAARIAKAERNQAIVMLGSAFAAILLCAAPVFFL